MLGALSVLLGGVQKLSQAFFSLRGAAGSFFFKCIVGLANLPNTPWDRRNNLMNFKNWHMSAIEPIRFVTPLFNFLEVEFVWSSPMSNVQRFSLWAAQDLNDLVSRRDLQIFRLHSVSILWGDTAPPKKTYGNWPRYLATLPTKCILKVFARMAGFNHQNFSRFQWARDPVATSLRCATHRPIAKQMKSAAASEHSRWWQLRQQS